MNLETWHALDTAARLVGRSRKQWLQETMKEVFNQFVRPYIDEDEEFEEYDLQHMQWLKEIAAERLI